MNTNRKTAKNSQSEFTELRRTINQQATQIEALSAKLDGLLERKSAVDEVSADVQAYLLQREQEMQSRLYDLQLATAIQLSSTGASQQILYQQLIRRIREVVRTAVPYEATVVVVSKGDDELLNLYNRKAWHFPQREDGVYAGYYPANGAAASIHLEVLRARGGDFLLFPETAFWWLNDPKYEDFKRHLEQRYRVVIHQPDTCMLYALREPGVWAELEAAIAECSSRMDRDPAILDCNTGTNLAASLPYYAIFSPPTQEETLPYVDKSVDVVVVPAALPGAVEEARRVAAEAVVVLEDARDKDGANLPTIERIDWLSQDAEVEFPTTSIIIPVHNGLSYTEVCLSTLRETLPRNFRGEIIVVDDASTDETPIRLKELAKQDKRLKIVRNAKNAGFLTSSNRGARAATGDILLFLNNDTVLLPDWLTPLLRVFRDFSEAGAVGGKLVFPDGTLQEAGGMIFSDGSAAHIGRGEKDINSPLYNYVRPVTYCSGALLATRRALFNEIGGFDTRYRPAYYEDTDYCFQVRARGWQIYYQPASTVVHLEGASSGTDITRGVKRYQILNQEKFVKKWQEVLKEHSARPSYANVAAWRVLALRPAVEGAVN